MRLSARAVLLASLIGAGSVLAAGRPSLNAYFQSTLADEA